MSAVVLLAPFAFLAADLPPVDVAAAAYAVQARNRGGARSSAAGQRVRNTSHSSINHGGNVNRGATVNRGGNVNRNANVRNNRNVNVNNVNVNRNVNVQGGGGYYGHGCYGCDWDNDHDFAVGAAVGVMTGAVVGAAAASSHNTTTVVVSPGTVVTALPGGCAATVVGTVTYQRCGSVWYQPQFYGSSVQYVVVNAPM